MKIKICGLTREEDIIYINKSMPNYAGFIFAENSKRQISIKQAELLKSKLDKNIQAVGVFVNAKISDILKTKNIIDIIQLHGNEDENYITELKNFVHKPIIKAFGANENIVKIAETKADYILMDSVSYRQFGGTGKKFDWKIIPENIKGRLFLAGGLNIDNIEEAIKINPYCLDINSGVETNLKKDEQKISAIIQKIKGYKNG